MSALVHCHICGYPIALDVGRHHPLGFQWDHVVPRALGGSNEPSNLRPSHAHCNRLKSAYRVTSASRIRPLDLGAAVAVIGVFREMPVRPQMVQIDVEQIRSMSPDEVYDEIREAVEDECCEVADVVEAEFPEVLAAFDEMDLTPLLTEQLADRLEGAVADLVAAALAEHQGAA